MLHRNVICPLALLCFSGAALALDIGFESQLGVSISDNVLGADAGSELEGQIGTAQFGVFGEQKGTTIRGAFSGELYSQRRLDDPDDEFSAVTQFIGAAEWNITPRTISWYVGDIIGGVRADDALQSIDDTDEPRRNVFVTGPQFTYELDSFSRLNARFLYINQSQDDTQLEALYDSTASWEFDTDRGNTWGLRFGNIYTDNPEENLEGDFNRFSVSGYWRRDRGRNRYEAQLGGTRYDTEDTSINGANARFTFNRQLSAQTAVSVALTRDLRDETLTTLETLFEDGTGIAPDGDGFFDETRLDLTYLFKSVDTNFDASVGVGQSDFRLLADNAGLFVDGDSEDRNNFYASGSISRSFTPRTTLTAKLSYEAQDFINRVDNNQSLLGTLEYGYQLTRSFQLQASYRGIVSDGERTRNAGAGDQLVELIDVIENRVTVGLRWAPPTRASKEQTIELKSLLR